MCLYFICAPMGSWRVESFSTQGDILYDTSHKTDMLGILQAKYRTKYLMFAFLQQSTLTCSVVQLCERMTGMSHLQSEEDAVVHHPQPIVVSLVHQEWLPFFTRTADSLQSVSADGFIDLHVNSCFSLGCRMRRFSPDLFWSTTGPTETVYSPTARAFPRNSWMHSPARWRLCMCVVFTFKTFPISAQYFPMSALVIRSIGIFFR